MASRIPTIPKLLHAVLDGVSFLLGRPDVPGDDRSKHRRGIVCISHKRDKPTPRDAFFVV